MACICTLLPGTMPSVAVHAMSLAWTWPNLKIPSSLFFFFKGGMTELDSGDVSELPLSSKVVVGVGFNRGRVVIDHDGFEQERMNGP